MGVSKQFSGWEEPGCIISWSKPVINRSLWKAASANCLYAVSQGCLCSVASARFTALETCCLCCLKPVTLFWEQWNICVPKWVSAERGRMMEGKKKKGGFREGVTRRLSQLQGPSAPRVVLSCSAVTNRGKLQSSHIHLHTVTVRWVCPSRLVKYSHHVFTISTGSILHHHQSLSMWAAYQTEELQTDTWL